VSNRSILPFWHFFLQELEWTLQNIHGLFAISITAGVIELEEVLIFTRSCQMACDDLA